jgi:hypothetical protein
MLAKEVARLIVIFKATDSGSSRATTLGEFEEGFRRCGSMIKNIEISYLVEAESNYM